MNRPNPLGPIVPVTPAGDPRPTLIRPDRRNAIFGGWGPRL